MMNFRKLHRILALPLALCVTLTAAVPAQAAQVLRNLVAVSYTHLTLPTKRIV